MAEIETFMSVSAGDIEKIMGIEDGDIEKVMGVEIPAGAPAWEGVRAMTHGRNASGRHKEILTRTISVSGSNATDYGDLSDNLSNSDIGGISDSVRMVTCGGYNSSALIDFVNVSSFASSGSGAVFQDEGTADTAKRSGGASASNGTTGVVCVNGYNSGMLNTGWYITIGSTGTMAATGNSSITRSEPMGISNATYGWICGGFTDDAGNWINENRIERFSFSSPTNAAIDAGNLSVARGYAAPGEDSTRAVLAGGGESIMDVIDYFNTSTGADAADFGDCVTNLQYAGGVSNGTIFEMWSGSSGTNTRGNWIHYITIQSTGNASDTGDTCTWESSSASQTGAATHAMASGVN